METMLLAKVSRITALLNQFLNTLSDIIIYVTRRFSLKRKEVDHQYFKYNQADNFSTVFRETSRRLSFIRGEVEGYRKDGERPEPVNHHNAFA